MLMNILKVFIVFTILLWYTINIYPLEEVYENFSSGGRLRFYRL